MTKTLATHSCIHTRYISLIDGNIGQVYCLRPRLGMNAGLHLMVRSVGRLQAKVQVTVG